LPGSLRAVGIDDGYFPVYYKKQLKKTVLAAVLCDDLEPVTMTIEPVTVDGLDAQAAAFRMLKKLNEYEVVFLDGVTYAGFNIIDPKELGRLVGKPVVTIFKHDLVLDKVKIALSKNFSDWRLRFAVIESIFRESRLIHTPWRRLRIFVYGQSYEAIIDDIIKLQNTSPIPEPLRLADIIASGLTRNDYFLRRLNFEFA